MKAIENPRTGKIGTQVAYLSPYGQCFRAYVVPQDPRTDAQMNMRIIFGSASRGWGLKLTDLQRELWSAAALNVPSHPWLGRYGHLSGQQLCVKINSTLRCVGQEPVTEPPDPVAFGPSPVGQFTIVNDHEAGIRLLLNVGAVTESIMLFGQAPCSRGRTKPRRVCYLGLLPPAADGQCDLTALYTARFGTPAPGQKVFLVTCQQKNGWKARDQVTSATVPPRSLPGTQFTPPAPQTPEPAAAAIPASPSAPSEPVSSSPGAVYKGGTPAAHRLPTPAEREHPARIPCAPLVHSLRLAIGRLFALARVGADNRPMASIERGKSSGEPAWLPFPLFGPLKGAHEAAD